jgi:hypothetical protein
MHGQFECILSLFKVKIIIKFALHMCLRKNKVDTYAAPVLHLIIQMSIQGTLTEGEVSGADDLLIKVACFVGKVNNIFNIKPDNLNSSTVPSLTSFQPIPRPGPIALFHPLNLNYFHIFYVKNVLSLIEEFITDTTDRNFGKS